MNIFILSDCPVESAQLQCDKHISKMCVESAQMLSTAHRILDGYIEKRPSNSGKRTVNYWEHPDPVMESTLYKAVHHHHPCTVWTMKTIENYSWHYKHFTALCEEYKYRYEREHKSWVILGDILDIFPRHLPLGGLTPFPLAMKANPECMFEGDAVRSYRAFYQTKQDRFKMVWTKRPTPDWFKIKETSCSTQ